jgi:hypothetical protein
MVCVMLLRVLYSLLTALLTVLTFDQEVEYIWVGITSNSDVKQNTACLLGDLAQCRPWTTITFLFFLVSAFP